MVACKALAVGLALVGLALAGSAPAMAQACNADITVNNPVFRLNPGQNPQILVLTLENNNPAGGLRLTYDKVFFRPNCRQVDSSQPPDQEASCGSGGVVMYDDGLPPLVGRPFGTPGGFLCLSQPVLASDPCCILEDGVCQPIPLTTCPGVAATEFYPFASPDPNNIDPGVEWLEFTFPGGPTPGFLKLDPPGGGFPDSCQIAFQLQVENFPATFPLGDPPTPQNEPQRTVSQITGTQAACLQSDGAPFDLPSEAKDSVAAEFLEPFCGAEVDKQVSCDFGVTWHDVTGSPDDPDGTGTAGCTGWDVPGNPEVQVRYFARNNSTGNFTNAGNNTLTSCALSDSNTAVLGGPVAVGDLPGFGDAGFAPGGVLLLETGLLECNSDLRAGEPNEATLACTCPAQLGGVSPPIAVTDTANIECEAPALEVTKVCEPGYNAGTELYEYTLQVTNPPDPPGPVGGATLVNCVIDDPDATCDVTSIAALPPGATELVSCTSGFKQNSATVSCTIQGTQKTIQRTAEAVCEPPTLTLDKQVSCDSGVSWNDVTDPGDPDFDDPGGAGIFGCIGWTGTPGEIQFRWIATSGGGIVRGCELTDTNSLVIAGAVQVGDFPNGIIHETTLLECDEQLLLGEPNTSTLTCDCPESPGVTNELTATDTATVEDCQEPALEVTKVCEPGYNAGTELYEYTVEVTNPPVANGATLVDCEIEDLTATCDPTSIAGPLPPGTTVPVSCESPYKHNEVTVTCFIQGTQKTIERTAEAVCTPPNLTVDKQVSCDGGVSWNDVTDPGDPDFDDPGGTGIFGCTGWRQPSDPNAPPVPNEVLFRWIGSSSGGIVRNCELTDSNSAVIAGTVFVGDFPSGVIHTTALLECNDTLLQGEPNTSTLSCNCPKSPGEDEVITATDSATVTCEEASVKVVKECQEGGGGTNVQSPPRAGLRGQTRGQAGGQAGDLTRGQTRQGVFTYSVTVMNDGTAPLANCVLFDPTADCSPGLEDTDLDPGQTTTATCTSMEAANTVKVTCDIVGTGSPQSPPKTVMDEDEAVCCEVTIDKQVSCDGGTNWNDVTGGDDADGEGIFGCTGWTPGSGDPEVKVRYFASSSLDAVCVLTDTNTAILPSAVPIVINAGGEEMFMTSLIACDETQTGWLEPDTATLSCECFDPTGGPLEVPPVEDTANIDCQEPDLRVEKSCEIDPADPDNFYTYTVSYENTGEAPLDNCELVDTSASDCDRSIGTLLPGDGDTVTCRSEFYTNTATVICDIREADKQIERSDEAECTPTVEVDKQVSCDSGATWHDVTGADDPDGLQIEGCIGWENVSDPNEQVLVRYIAESNGYLVNCELSDTNEVFILGQLPVGDNPDGEIFQTPLTTCDDNQLGWLEPNTATLDCSCLEAPGLPPTPGISASDTANIDCQEPDLRVEKSCEIDPADPDNFYTYTVSYENTGEAPLDNCELVDTSASDCDRSIGTLLPGDGDTVTCRSEFYTNTATVICDIREADKQIERSDEAECTPTVEVDKQVSCDSGATWHDVTGADDPDGLQIEGCIGWENVSDPNEQVLVRYIAESNGYLVNCELSDTNEVFILGQLPVGDNPDGEIFQTPLTTCDDNQLGWLEPNTATLDCSCLEAPGLPPTPGISDSDTANIDCQEPDLRVEKSCEIDPADPDNFYTYTVSYENTGEAPLDNCELVDTSASDCDRSIGTLLPGDGDTVTCRSEFYTNTATVICDIREADKQIERSDEAECTPTVEVDKQVSCDSGATWHDVTGADDPDGLQIEGCIGWENVSDPNEQVLVRYIAESNGYLVNCELSDTNEVFILGQLPVGDNPDGEIFQTPLTTCDDNQLGWLEPNTATLDCSCLEAPGLPPTPGISDSDTANIDCQEPDLRVEKSCEIDPADPDNFYTYTVSYENTGEAPLDNCELVDTSASDCDRSIGTLLPGDGDTVTCRSEFYTNTATVICDIREADKQIERSDEAECTPTVEVDKQVSCDSGATWHDVTGADDPDGLQIEGCIGWENVSDPNEQVLVRYIAESNGYLVNCELSDTNEVFILGQLPVGDNPDGEIFQTPLTTCDDNQLGWLEPNTATLDCSCLEAPGLPPTPGISDSDTAMIECQEPALEVTKECAVDLDPATGLFDYTVTAINPVNPDGATLVNCVVSDPDTSCDGAVIAGQLTPGQDASVQCLGANDTNTATVTCEIQGAFDANGNPKTISAEGFDDCLVCELAVEKTCVVIEPPAGDFDCSDAKPLDVLVMIWDGTATIDVIAYEGDVGDPVVGQVFGIVPGEEVSISGFADAPNDVYWEIFAAGTNNKLGESKFHRSCSDDDMDGPEDCGKRQGNGKSDDGGFINDWLLEGLEGNGLVLDCTPTPAVPAESCVADLGPLPSCETVGDPDNLTWRFTGGGCAASDNSQEPGKATCDESSPGIDPDQPVTITDDQDNVFVVQPGEEFTTTRSASKKLFLNQSGRFENQEIHVSCSQPLIAGEAFGSLTLSALDGNRAEVEVLYEYTVTNLGNATAFDISVNDDPDPGDPFAVPGSPIAQLGVAESITLSSTRMLTETTTNVVTVGGAVGSPTGPTCQATDEVTVSFEGFFIRKECAERDANGDNAVTITLMNVGDMDLVCDVEDPLANFQQNGIQLAAGDTVVLQATVSGLVDEELNTATANCVQVQSGEALPPQSSTDLCEVPDEPGFQISKLCAVRDPSGNNAVEITLTNTGSFDLVCDVSDPLAGGFFEAGVLLPQGGPPVVLNTVVSGLSDDTVNTATADCTVDVSGETLPTETATDLCEFEEECDLTVDKTCLVVPSPTGSFNCSDAKPINVVAMIWDGVGTVDIKAWKGSVGSTSLGTITGIAPGQEIAVVGYAGSPNDVYWEIFEAGTGFTVKRGESKFHLSCSDSEMNGPEDCGKSQGNGKSNESGLINDWLFEGLEGEGQVLDCTPTPGASANSCEASLGPLPSCETVGDPDTLTWRYTGGGCAASDNSQGAGKSICSESSPGIDAGLPVTVTDDDGNVFNVAPGEEFTTSRSDSKMLYLSQPGRWEEHEVHVSCSQPLVASESYGSLTIAALDGQRADVEVDYEYTVINGGSPLVNVSVVDDKIDLGIAPFDLATDETRVFSATSLLEATTENRVDVAGELPSGQLCEAFDTVIVTITEPVEPCAECAGGVTELAFRNIGAGAFVEIEDKNETLFSDFLATGASTPTLEGTKSDGKFDGDVKVYRDGDLAASIHTSCSQPIGVSLEFGGLEVVSGRSKDGGPFCAADCQPTALNFEVKDDELKLRIANSGQTPLQIGRIEVQWPAGKGNLEKIEFDGKIWEGQAPPTSFSIDSGWLGSPGDRALDPGDDHDLKFRFKDKQKSGFHSVKVDFSSGCSLEASSN